MSKILSREVLKRLLFDHANPTRHWGITESSTRAEILDHDAALRAEVERLSGPCCTCGNLNSHGAVCDDCMGELEVLREELRATDRTQAQTPTPDTPE